jgi:hypothetical protein
MHVCFIHGIFFFGWKKLDHHSLEKIRCHADSNLVSVVFSDVVSTGIWNPSTWPFLVHPFNSAAARLEAVAGCSSTLEPGVRVGILKAG